jgi:hypothetical protein
MTRTEQLRTCRKCHHINFDIKKGFICGKTSNYATFTDKCFDYKEATFISKKKVLKTAQLSMDERVKSSTRSLLFKKVLLIFALVFMGCLMLDDPNLFSLNAAKMTDSVARKVLSFFWGIPSGLFSLFGGLYLSYRLITKK